MVTEIIEDPGALFIAAILFECGQWHDFYYFTDHQVFDDLGIGRHSGENRNPRYKIIKRLLTPT